MAKSEHLDDIADMLHHSRWAALATVDAEGLPNGSMVAYAIDSSQACLYLHLSRLAAHTREIQQQPACSLVIAQCDQGEGDPQQLARLTLRGQCKEVERDTPAWEEAKSRYLGRLPDALQLFSFSDFALFQFELDSGRFVGGFGQAHSYRSDELKALLQSSD